MCSKYEILEDAIYTNGDQEVITDEVDQERATVIYWVISGEDSGKSKICGFTQFRRKYQEV